MICQLPKSVGGLNVLTGNNWNPEIFGNKFIIPNDTEVVHSLLGNTQMLLKLQSNKRKRRTGSSVFLIGIDDNNPFITNISTRRYQEFLENGEDAFYKSLIPKSISLMSVHATSVVLRQGDIWAIKVAEDFNDILNGVSDFPLAPNQKQFIENKSNSYHSVYSEPLMDSRHEIEGDIIKNIFVITGKTRRGGIKTISLFLGRGIITAPDHPSLIIDDGVYVIDRTSGQNEMCIGTD